MDWLTNLIWHDGKLLGIEWSFWKAIGCWATLFLHPFSCSMVCHREEKTRGGANGVLVAEFSWCTVNAGVFVHNGIRFLFVPTL